MEAEAAAEEEAQQQQEQEQVEQDDPEPALHEEVVEESEEVFIKQDPASEGHQEEDEDEQDQDQDPEVRRREIQRELEVRKSLIFVHCSVNHLSTRHVQDDAQGDTDPDFDPRAELEEEDQGKMRTRPRNKLIKFSRMSHKVRYGKIIVSFHLKHDFLPGPGCRPQALPSQDAPSSHRAGGHQRHPGRGQALPGPGGGGGGRGSGRGKLEERTERALRRAGMRVSRISRICVAKVTARHFEQVRLLIPL